MRRAMLPALLLASTALGAVKLQAPAYEVIAPGVAYARVEEDAPPLVFHVVKVDLRARKDGTSIAIEAIRSAGSQTVAQIADSLTRARRPLLVAINADFFDRNDGETIPWGIHAQGGTLLFSPTNKSAFMIDAQGRPQIANPTLKLAARLPPGAKPILGVNRARAAGEEGLFLYTPAWGSLLPEAPNGAVIVLSGGPLTIGKTVKCTVEEIKGASSPTPIPPQGCLLTCSGREIDLFRRVGLKSEVLIRGDLTPAATEAIGGGPRIVRAGKPSVEAKDENFPRSHAAILSNQEHPRAAVGYNQARTVVIFLIVEGRTAESNGVTLASLAQLMLLVGAYDAMNLDGGGSATLYVAGRMVTHGGIADATAQRHVANAIGVFYHAKANGE